MNEDITNDENSKRMEGVRVVNLDRVRGERLKVLYGEARSEAQNEYNLLKSEPLFIAGVMLYRGGGTKSLAHQVKFTSTDPISVKLFCSFLVDLCGISRDTLRISLLIYPDIDELSAQRFWSFATGVPFESFYRTTLLPRRSKQRKASQGTCTVILNSSYFTLKLQEWVALLSKTLMERA
jgi:hypothetical protein